MPCLPNSMRTCSTCWATSSRTGGSTPSQEDALKAYITLSRVERAENIVVAQPFSPALFTQGVFEAAELFLKVLRGTVPKEGLEEEWRQLEERKAKRKNQLTAQEWPCGFCKRPQRWVAFASDVNGEPTEQISTYVLKPGSWRCCQRCLLGQTSDPATGLSAPKTYRCKECGVERDARSYLGEEIKLLLDAGRRTDLVCLICRPEVFAKFAGRQ